MGEEISWDGWNGHDGVTGIFMGRLGCVSISKDIFAKDIFAKDVFWTSAIWMGRE